ncbi:MAG: valine--tRNA ligase [Candidatus Moranbacteria bacterium]|nr:valine--tRNA ligase [Candidatus Moranbacteria bacterium]
MKKEIPKIYKPGSIEEKIYDKWEKSGYFNPDKLANDKIISENAKPYSIVLPPPNITDKLHLGHSSVLAIEDLLIRFHRMKGFRALWIPGTDHAAIATQNVVEKKLLKETGKSRHDLGKKKFLKEVWKFLRETQTVILKQARKMGASLDWSREAFTLDEPRKKAVEKMFVDMHKEGIIYRGERIVNWCPRCHSTLADDEIEYEKQKAKLYTFKYSKDFPVSISTTRPETKLGDTAVAVNPKDKRYKDIIGKKFSADFCGIGLNIRIIADNEVDMDFGTGALGVTPAHSITDWRMAEENNLEIKKVIDENGKIRKGFGKFSGKTAEEARKSVVAELKKQGLIEKEEEIENNLSVCYRCGTAVEPLPSKQWFVAVDKKLERLGNKSLKEKAIEAAQEKEIKFFPERFEKRYLDWMENLHDWCISRQIWFGHSIPAWHKKDSDEVYVGEKAPEDKENWIQDSDSLDTWFSSGMWTFSTMGWPETFTNGKKSGDLAEYHPTDVLNTGYEILTLWVSRMIMMSLFAIGEIPFRHVYLNGMVLDEYGKKMSKSKGNGIDPLDMIEKYGTDAVRLSLLIGSTPGNDVRVGEEKIGNFRNFTNKLWNISRFIISKEKEADNKEQETENLTLADKWITRKMASLIKKTSEDIGEYKFSQAGERLYDFTWHEFADWYLEISKFEENKKEKDYILNAVLKDLLKLWHPFIPFITENIWSHLDNKKFLMVESYPDEKFYRENFAAANDTDMVDFDAVIEIIKSARAIRNENKIGSGKRMDIFIDAEKTIGISTDDIKGFILSQEKIIKNLRTGIGKIKFLSRGERIEGVVSKTTSNGITVYARLKELVDTEKERASAENEINNLEKYISGLEKKLSDKNFVKKAPKEVVEQEKEKLKKAQIKSEEIKKYLEQL